MRRIKFSHYYFKMNGFDMRKPFVLEKVEKQHYGELSASFIEQDTAFDGGHYDLPKGWLIVLLLTQNGVAMTTIRRWTPDKEKYYQSVIGQYFICEIEKGLEASA